MDKNELHKILSKPFDHEAWLEVLKSVFGVRQLLREPTSIILPDTRKAKAAFELGSFTTSDGRVIGLYKVEMMPGIRLDRNKAGLRALLSVFRNIYRYDVDGALIVFTGEQGEKWRLSYVSEIKVLNEDGEIVSQATEPKRYTYLLGPGEKVLTPANQLSKLSGKNLTLEDIRSAFSVEALNEAFYKIIAEQFYQLIGGATGTGTTGKSKNAKTYDGLLKLPCVPKENRRIYQEFAVRLIGRTVFCWFLKVKKSDDSKPLVPESLLSSKALKTNTNYYHRILEPLFFQTLNTPMEKRSRHLPEGCKNVPFLNGGLFEQGPDDFYKPNLKTGLSDHLCQRHPLGNTLLIPDKWFEKLFSELEKYNFTIDENSVTEVEVSVDPEMLGRIFENLLAEIDPDSGETARKATGSFYTPREIVDYMATESLVQYLHHKTSLAQAKLRPLFEMTADHAKDVTGETLEFTAENKEALLNALDKVKILDPACGSGAFPMGVLQKMLMALQNLDPECQWWINRQIDRIENALLKKQITEKLSGASVEYARKMGIIQNSLFGVDIQPIAAEISKLRCFLTLVVDEHIDESKPNRGIEPLPNLEFKFITANTLLKLPEEGDYGGLFNANDDLDALKKLRSEYLQSCGEEKVKIKEDFKKIQDRIYKQQISHAKNIDVNSRAYLVSTWKPFSHVRKDSFGEQANWFDPEWMFGEKEFDLVIGNPPYVRQEKYKSYKDKIKDSYPEVFNGRADLYTYFVKLGIDILNDHGTLSYITSNKFIIRGYGKQIRDFLVSETAIKKLINFGELPVFQASVDSLITITKKEVPEKDHVIYFAQAKKAEHILNINKFFTENSNAKPLSKLDDPWILQDQKHEKVLEKVCKISNTLGSLHEIFGGIKTGLDDAFVISQETRGLLIQKDSKSLDLIRPWYKGRDIKKWRSVSDSFIIYIPQNSVDIDEYPAIKEHLEKYKSKLEKRATKQNWYELQQPQQRFCKLFDKKKIIYSEIAKEMRALSDSSGAYGTMKMFFIPYNPVVLGILNSNFFDWYSRMKCSSLGDPWNGGRIEFKSMYMEKLPLPDLETKTAISIGKVTEEILNSLEDVKDKEKQLNELVYDLYELTAEERELVLNS